MTIYEINELKYIKQGKNIFKDSIKHVGLQKLGEIPAKRQRDKKYISELVASNKKFTGKNVVIIQTQDDNTYFCAGVYYPKSKVLDFPNFSIRNVLAYYFNQRGMFYDVCAELENNDKQLNVRK